MIKWLETLRYLVVQPAKVQIWQFVNHTCRLGRPVRCGECDCYHQFRSCTTNTIIEKWRDIQLVSKKKPTTMDLHEPVVLLNRVNRNAKKQLLVTQNSYAFLSEHRRSQPSRKTKVRQVSVLTQIRYNRFSGTNINKYTKSTRDTNRCMRKWRSF